MNRLVAFSLFMLALSNLAVADSAPAKVYLNEHVGFNVKGFKYDQKAFPCDIDKSLVAGMVEQGQKQKLPLEVVGTVDKLRNGIIPVIAVDIEQLALGKKDFNFVSNDRNNTLPMIQATAAIIKGKDLLLAKHTCAFAGLNAFTPSSNVLDLGTTTTVCKALRRCARDLSKDIMTWAAAELK